MMTNCNDFLVEIGTEELPPKALNKLSIAFAEGIKTGLDKAELNYQKVHCYGSPRRLAVLIEGLAEEQEDKSIERRGPALKTAFNAEGKPSAAALGFAKSCGVNITELTSLETPQGTWLVFRSLAKGKATSELMPIIVEDSLNQLPIPKRMRWGNESHQFVRPVHWLLMLFGDRIVPCEILGCRASRETYGHRFHHPNAITIDEPKQYANKLETYGYVITDYQKRKEKIRQEILETALHVNGEPVIDGKLLDEVTGLVEWPVSILASFDEEYLDIPSEALISAMKLHQKYFHFIDKNGCLLPQFITIANIQSSHPNSIKLGNERVIRPRLADAEFFWEQDKKIKLADRLMDLNKVVFQNQLGTIYDKVKRVSKLSSHIAEVIGGDVMLAERAAHLSKCDLLTEMVNEFSDLQGVMGRYYAINDREDQEVALAMQEIYMPRFAGDDLPETSTGLILALAERIDTLVGIFGIGQIPTGAKDPFALRRAALGVLRLITEKELSLDLGILIQQSIKTYSDIELDPKITENLLKFFAARSAAMYQDKGISSQVIKSVQALKINQPYDFENRVNAVQIFDALDESKDLSEANKRVKNILAKSDCDANKIELDQSLFEQEEQALYDMIQKVKGSVHSQIDAGHYISALQELANLKDVVNLFFDKVMINVEDDNIKNNRFALINELRNLFLGIADISLLQK